MKKLKYLITILYLALALSVLAQQPFKPGNIVVYRVGDGSAALASGIASKVFLEEYTSSGTFVQAIEMPSSGSQKITAGGGNQYGYMTLSSNGKYLVVPGFNKILGSLTVPLDKSIGLVDYNGAISSITALSNPTNSQPVSAVSDNGTNLWLAGSGIDVEYATVGSSTASEVLTTPLATRTITIADGQLYVAQSGGTIQKVGTSPGLPVNNGQTAVDLPGIGNINPRGQFAFADLNPAVTGVDVLYACSQLNDGLGGIHKYSLVNGSWVLNGNITTTPPATGNDNDRYTGLTIKVSGNSVTIFATRAGSNSNNLSGIQGGQLVSLTDNSGYNGTLTGTPTLLADITTRFTANYAAFRGVALVPQACKAVGNLQALNVTSSQATVTWSATNGETNFEYVVTTSPTPPLSGFTATSNTSVLLTGLTNGVTYYVHVRTNCLLSPSEWSTVSFTTSCRPPEVSFLNVVITATGVVNVNWNAVFGASSYEYQISTGANPPSAGIAIADTSISLSGLDAITTYYVHVRSDCGGGAFSSWVTKSFSIGCIMPTIRVSVIKNTATATWNRINKVIKYEYALTNTPAKPLSGTYTTDTFHHIINRIDGSANYFHVRSLCTNGTLSDWATADFRMQGMQVYPNPTREILHIQLNGLVNNNGRISIGDMVGRLLVKEATFTGNSMTIDVRTWATGIYWVRYYDGQNKYTVKIIKQ